MTNQTKQITFDDLVEQEARRIATDLIERELSRQDLPLPKDVTVHAQALLDAKPALRETARKNVEARTDGYTDALRALGIELQIIRAVPITLDDEPEPEAA